VARSSSTFIIFFIAVSAAPPMTTSTYSRQTTTSGPAHLPLAVKAVPSPPTVELTVAPDLLYSSRR
jgi:hypothetical protein